jgi:hypothetical protein
MLEKQQYVRKSAWRQVGTRRTSSGWGISWAILANAQPNGGRPWWAHFEFSRIGITPIILPKKIEDAPEAGSIGVNDQLNFPG